MHSKKTVAGVSKELFAQDEIFNEEEEHANLPYVPPRNESALNLTSAYNITWKRIGTKPADINHNIKSTSDRCEAMTFTRADRNTRHDIVVYNSTYRASLR